MPSFFSTKRYASRDLYMLGKTFTKCFRWLWCVFKEICVSVWSKNMNIGFFSRTFWAEIFWTLHDNLHWSWHIFATVLVTFDQISRSQWCWRLNRKLSVLTGSCPDLFKLLCFIYIHIYMDMACISLTYFAIYSFITCLCKIFTVVVLADTVSVKSLKMCMIITSSLWAVYTHCHLSLIPRLSHSHNRIHIHTKERWQKHTYMQLSMQ